MKSKWIASDLSHFMAPHSGYSSHTVIRNMGLGNLPWTAKHFWFWHPPKFKSDIKHMEKLTLEINENHAISPNNAKYSMCIN